MAHTAPESEGYPLPGAVSACRISVRGAPREAVGLRLAFDTRPDQLTWQSQRCKRSTKSPPARRESRVWRDSKREGDSLPNTDATRTYAQRAFASPQSSLGAALGQALLSLAPDPSRKLHHPISAVGHVRLRQRFVDRLLQCSAIRVTPLTTAFCVPRASECNGPEAHCAPFRLSDTACKMTASRP